jgi:hypothetical protein
VPTLRVTYHQSVFAGRELVFQDTIVLVGRDPGCDVRFDETAERIVSRNHAEIRWGSVGPIIFPLKGKVVLLRGERLSGPTPLAPGDLIVLAGPGGPSFEVQFEVPNLNDLPLIPEVQHPPETTEEGVPPWVPAANVGESTIDPRAMIAATPDEGERTGEEAPQVDRLAGAAVKGVPTRRIKSVIIAAFVLVTGASLAMAWWSSTRPTTQSAPSRGVTTRP